MDGGEVEPAARPSSRRVAAASVRWARLSDVRTLARLYRGQSAESRRNYHPYPFDRLRLLPILVAMLLSSRIVGTLRRLAPNLAFVILIAEPRAGGAPIGFCTIRLVRRGRDPIWARFGYLVEEGHRGEGVGFQLAVAQWRIALELGVRRGGGTVMEGNLPSSRLLEPFGFRLAPSPEADRHGGDRANLGSVQDLEKALAEVRRQGGWRAELLSDEIRR